MEISARLARQKVVYEWGIRCFGLAHMVSPAQRGLRFLEEAVELYQAAGGTAETAHKLVDFIFAREPGEIGQEIGGVGVTLLAFAESVRLDADAEEAREVERVLSKSPEYFAARNAAKCAAGFDAT